MKPHLKAAVGGYLICTAINSLFQDFLGKEVFMGIFGG